jgi:acylphosphatase
MNRYLVVVSGIVQGVGFRYFVSYTARALNLTGWVRNCFNDTVQLHVQGKEEDILVFMQKLRKGNGYSEVEDVSMKKVDMVENEKSFKIIG